MYDGESARSNTREICKSNRPKAMVDGHKNGFAFFGKIFSVVAVLFNPVSVCKASSM
jgi:hypothetical protein